MATLPVFRTWVAGEVVTAAYFNANVRDAGNFFLSVPTFEGRQTVAQSFTSGTAAPFSLDTEDFDNDNGHSTVSLTSRYVGQTAGRFQASGGGSWANNTAGQRAVELWRNGALPPGAGTFHAANSGTSTHRQASRTLSFVLNGTTDYLEVAGFQNSGGALNSAVSGVEQATLSVRWIGTT